MKLTCWLFKNISGYNWPIIFLFHCLKAQNQIITCGSKVSSRPLVSHWARNTDRLSFITWKTHINNHIFISKSWWWFWIRVSSHLWVQYILGYQVLQTLLVFQGHPEVKNRNWIKWLVSQKALWTIVMSKNKILQIGRNPEKQYIFSSNCTEALMSTNIRCHKQLYFLFDFFKNSGIKLISQNYLTGSPISPGKPMNPGGPRCPVEPGSPGSP